MTRMLEPKNGCADAETVNAAYGLVNGIYEAGDASGNTAHREWQKPEVQQAAMEAAKAFMATVRNRKQ